MWASSVHFGPAQNAKTLNLDLKHSGFNYRPSPKSLIYLFLLKWKTKLIGAMSVQLDSTGENMDESLRIQRFEQIPSSLEFESLIQSTNVPAVKFTHTHSLSLYFLFVSRENKMLLKTFYFFLLLFIYRCLLDALRTGKLFPSGIHPMAALTICRFSFQTL